MGRLEGLGLGPCGFFPWEAEVHEVASDPTPSNHPLTPPQALRGYVQVYDQGYNAGGQASVLALGLELKA